MSLLFNGSKTLTLAGTEIQCLEIYTGESYTLPLSFTDSTGAPVNCTGWTLATEAKFYSVDDIAYPNEDEIVLGNLTLLNPQPSTGVGTYSANLIANFTTPASGLGFLYIPATLTGGSGTPNPTPVIALANNTSNSTLVVVTLTVTRTDPLSTRVNTSREPFGLIVRYQ